MCPGDLAHGGCSPASLPLQGPTPATQVFAQKGSSVPGTASTVQCQGHAVGAEVSVWLPQREHWALVALVPGRGRLSRHASECQMLGFRCDPVRLLGGSLASGYGPVQEEVAWSWHPGSWADEPELSPGRPPLCQPRLQAPAPPFVSCVVSVNLGISLSLSFLLCEEGAVAPASTRSLWTEATVGHLPALRQSAGHGTTAGPPSPCDLKYNWAGEHSPSRPCWVVMGAEGWLPPAPLKSGKLGALAPPGSTFVKCDPLHLPWPPFTATGFYGPSNTCIRPAAPWELMLTVALTPLMLGVQCLPLFNGSARHKRALSLAVFRSLDGILKIFAELAGSLSRELHGLCFLSTSI